MKFILLHESKNEEGIKAFFMEIWENYVKASIVSLLCARLSTLTVLAFYQTMMNPFHRSDRPISSPVFDARVRASAKKNL